MKSVFCNNKGFIPLEVLREKIVAIFSPRASKKSGRFGVACCDSSSRRDGALLTGFTLAEVIVAVGIIVFGVVGGLSLITFSLNTVRVARNRSVAVAALQEGMEIVRAMRDDNWHVDRTWDDFISGRNIGACANVQTYTVDAVTYHGLVDPMDARSVLSCTPSTIEDSGALLYITPQGRFTHSSSGGAVPVANNLRRLIQVIPSPAGCDGTLGNECIALGVVVDVEFNSGSRVSALRAVDQLWNWR